MDFRIRVGMALASIYLIWGSTYLAIKYTIDTMPPLLSAGARFIIAGGLIYIVTRLAGKEKPKQTHWISAGKIGLLLMLCGNGGVVWAEQYVSSSITAIMIATTPFCIVILNWFVGDNKRPSLGVLGGLVIGFIGVAILVYDGKGNFDVSPIGTLVLLIAAFCWALGSIYSKKAELPKSIIMAGGMQMLIGGVSLVIFGILVGEAGHIRPDNITTESVIAFFYLIVFGSWVGFLSYIWLLQNVSPTLVSTYGYVNPIVAVILGYALRDELFSIKTAIAMIVILAAVMLVTASNRGHKKVN